MRWTAVALGVLGGGAAFAFYGVRGPKVVEPATDVATCSAELPSPSCAEVARVQHTRTRLRPGGAVSWSLHFFDRDGRALEGADYSACVQLRNADSCAVLPTSTVTITPKPRVVLVVDRAGPEAGRRARAVLEGLPDGVAAATFVWDGALAQVDTFRTEPRFAGGVLRTLEAGPPRARDSEELASMLVDVRERVVDVGAGTFEGATMVVVVSGAVEPTRGLDEPLWLVTEDGDVARVSAEIQRLAQTRGVRVGHCRDGLARAELHAGQGRIRVPVPRAVPEMGDAECDASAAAADRYAPPRVVQLHMTDAQVSAYAAIADERDSETNFELRIGFDGSTEPVAARASLRGKSSLRCERKSFSVNLKGSRARVWHADAASDEFVLLSMCRDEGYIEQVTAARLLRGLGLFPFAFQFVELRMNGESQGAYLMMEKAKEHALERYSGVRSVLRRGVERNGPSADVKWSRGPAWRSQSQYRELVEAVHSGVDTLAPLERRLDTAAVLRWLAGMSLLGVGDYADELWLVGLETVRRGGGDVQRFVPMAWDVDDLFSRCRDRVEDDLEPSPLAYCPEGALERALLATPAGEEAFATALAALLADWSQERFNAEVAQTVAELRSILRSPEARHAMVKLRERAPEAVATEEGLAVWLEGRATELRERFSERRIEVERRLRSWRRTRAPGP